MGIKEIEEVRHVLGLEIPQSNPSTLTKPKLKAPESFGLGDGKFISIKRIPLLHPN